MTSQGYSLLRVEMLNWGNFQNWQVIELKGPAGFGPLLDGSPNSLIAGVNGAGKSTLIDGIMATLLPFDQALKLGVTHDSEAGTKGGRNIRDYVLGKYSSSGDAALAREAMVYSRRTGVSALLLVFQHNARPESLVSAGRAWWYSEGKLRDDSAAFLAARELSIGDPGKMNLLDAEGRPFASAGEFRRRMEAKDPRIQAFDKLGTYFQALSGTLGSMTREDLKLLNQAFYLKSVSNIDAFVRAYMLVERENESIGKLISHVEVAAEISRSIEACERQLWQIQRILNALETYRRHCEERAEIERQQRFVQIHPVWEAWRSALIGTEERERRAAEARMRLPALLDRAGELRRDWERVQSLLAQNQSLATIRALEAENENLSEQIRRLEKDLARFREYGDLLDVKLPGTAAKLPAFQEKCRKLATELATEEQGIERSRTDYAVEMRGLESRRGAVKEELQFAAEHRTLIPKRIYAIKQECLSALRLPQSALMFVGELATVREDGEEFRRAVEAALQPISRNLLCLPEHIEAVTRWVNRTGLSHTLTVKRIRPEEMSPPRPPGFHPSSILAQVQLRDREENPFHDYLWAWLCGHFYHRIVPVDEFKTQVDKAVTREGLVKQDARTMRKHKEGLEYSLGWESARREAQLRAELDAILDRQAQLAKLDGDTNSALAAARARRQAAEQLVGADASFLGIHSFVDRRNANEREIQKLTKGDLEAAALRNEESRLKSEMASADTQAARCSADIDRDERDAGELRRQAETRKNELAGVFGTEWDVGLEKLEALDAMLRTRALSASAYGEEILRKIKEIEHRKVSNPVAGYMSEYESEHHDPNLHYAIGVEEELPALIAEWGQAKRLLETTGLPQVKQKWESFYSDTLVEAIKTAINDIRMEQGEIRENIQSINAILRRTDFENLPTEKRYLQIVTSPSQDERVRGFLADVKRVEGVLSGMMRSLDAVASAKQVMAVLEPFVRTLQEDPNYRSYVVDVRNHYRFAVHSRRRMEPGMEEPIMESFAGSRTDAKSSAQTTQLAYTLLASALAYRFHFYDPVRGRDSLRLIILDEFGGKFDNEKPKDIVALLRDMGFQSVLVSPMSKADLLAEYIGRLVLVYKASASQSRVKSHEIRSRLDYEAIVHGKTPALATAAENA